MRKYGATFAIGFALAAVLASGFASPAQATLRAVSPAPFASGNGYPDWYLDTAGTSLGQCNFGPVVDPLCIPNGPPTGVGNTCPFDEAFFWTALPPAGALDGGNVTGVVVVFALEATCIQGVAPAPNDLLVFSRIRIRADIAAAGTYTITHPFGVETFTIDVPLNNRDINFTNDVGIAVPGDFAAALAGTPAPTNGPFLTCVDPPPPAGYLGNFGIPCTVTGSPFGSNLVHIKGPGTDTVSRLFEVSGKLMVPAVPVPPLTLTPPTYQCLGGACETTVNATSDPTATLSASIAGFPSPMTAVPGTPGAFTATIIVPQAQIPLPVDGVNTFPVQAMVSTTVAGLPVVEKNVSLVDLVNISQASHNTATGILTVNARSGDPRAVLTEASLGPLAGGQLFFDLDGFGGAGVPLGSVNVISSGGGSATSLTTFTSVPEKLRASATFNGARRRLTVTGTSTAKGATIVLRSLTNPLGTGAVVNAKGGFKAVARVSRKPRFVKVISSGGKSVRVAVR